MLKNRIRGLIVDSFAGGGGASLGIKWAAGREPDIAINHDADAITMHAANHPGTRHITEDVFNVDPIAITGGRRVALFWASPDCRHFSRAKGGKPVEKKIRSLAWFVVKFAEKVKPDQIMLENVREFAEWGPIVPAWRCGACSWRGTEGQAVLKRSTRRCPQCESKRLTISEDMIPDPQRKGITFKRWVGRLKALGYVVEHKNLNAADYGVRTHRRRLFLIARRDGKPIVWPEPTHGDPKKLDALPLFDRLEPWQPVSSCIDWSLPCPSIFDRKRPLADATLRRIAMGIKRYVLDNPQPFIVGVGGRMGQSPAAGTDEPSNTITGKNDRAVIVPYLVGAGGPGYAAKPRPTDQPIGSILKENHSAIVTPVLVRTAQTGAEGKNCFPLTEPLGVIVSKNEHVLVSPTLIQVGYGERKGQSPRVPGLDKPHGSVVSGGGKTAIVAAFLAKHFGGHQTPGSSIGNPIDTITAKDHHSLVAANLIRMSFGEKSWNGCDEPMPTATSQHNHLGLIYSFLIRYFGTAIGQHCTEPLFTVTGKDRFGLVVVKVGGEPYVIADIGMRMLTPRELARAQGFPDDYILTGTKSNQVAKIGNSVCPMMAKVLAEANLFASAEVQSCQ